MNKVLEMFNGISDEEIQQGVREIQNDEKTGIICDGIVRKYAAKMGELTNNNHTLHLMASEISILRQAAYRWINNK